MSKKLRNTCGCCPHLTRNDLGMGGGVVFGCEITGYIVPQHSERKGDRWITTFWRVPMSCPLPDTEVTKSKERAPENDWYTYTQYIPGAVLVEAEAVGGVDR